MAAERSGRWLAVIALTGLAVAACSGPAATGPAHAGAGAPSPSRTAPAPGSPAPGSPAGTPQPGQPPRSSSRPHRPAPHAATMSYFTYVNARYGFSALRPARFVMEPLPEDGDGAEWITDGGRVTMAVYGSNNPTRLSMGQQVADIDQGLVITYQAVDGDVVTVSGFTAGGSKIDYIRAVIGPGSTDTLQWVYPAKQKARWDAAVARTALAFRPGDLTTGH